MVDSWRVSQPAAAVTAVTAGALGTNVSCLSTLTLRSWNVIEHSSRPSLKMLYDVRQWGPVSRFLNEVEIDIVKNQIE